MRKRLAKYPKLLLGVDRLKEHELPRHQSFLARLIDGVVRLATKLIYRVRGISIRQSHKTFGRGLLRPLFGKRSISVEAGGTIYVTRMTVADTCRVDNA